MNANAEEREARAEHADGVLGWLGDVADEARELVAERVDGVVQHAAQAAHEEWQRFEARVRRAAILAGVLAAGALLIVTGLAGALGELVGRPWVGQIGVGVGVFVIASAWFALSARAQRRRAAAQAAERASREPATRTTIASIAAAGAAGWIAGQFLARRR